MPEFAMIHSNTAFVSCFLPCGSIHKLNPAITQEVHRSELSTIKSPYRNNHLLSKLRASGKPFTDIERASDIDIRTQANQTHSEIRATKDPVVIIKHEPKVDLGPLKSVNILLVNAAIALLDRIYPSSGPCAQTYRRFWVLETIARVPYFAYVSVLHLYETLSIRHPIRQDRRLQLHFFESLNETHHLEFMEQLGAGNLWSDQFLAQHIAFFYYWFTVIVFILKPNVAYHLNELVERHAFETYDHFLTQNQEALQKLDPIENAKRYYASYMWQGMVHVGDGDDLVSVPEIQSLYDVFVAVRNDEAIHSNALYEFQDI